MIQELQAYKAYKESSIPWLGRVPAHWEVVLNQRILKEEIRSYDGQPETQLSLSQKDGLIATSEMQERSLQTSSFDNWKVTLPGDLVLNRFKAHLGVFFASNMRGIVSYHYGVFVPRRPMVTRYFELLYHTNVYRTIYAGRSNGMTVGLQNLSNQNFYNVRSIVPPIDEQAAIVRFLDHADRRIRHYIRAKQKMISLLEEQKRDIIYHTVTRGLEQSARLKSSGTDWLGDIPEHWDIRRAKYLFSEVDCRSETGSEVLLSLRMYQGLIPHNEVSLVPISPESLIGFKKVKPGQLVMNRMRAAIGMFAIARQHGIVSPDYAVFQPRINMETTYFLSLFKTAAAGSIFRMESKGLGTGTSGFMRLYTDRFGTIKLPAPPVEEQRQIAHALKERTAEINNAQERSRREVALIQEFRTRLIADVVTGKLDVREATAKLPDGVNEPADDMSAGDTLEVMDETLSELGDEEIA